METAPQHDADEALPARGSGSAACQKSAGTADDDSYGHESTDVVDVFRWCGMSGGMFASTHHVSKVRSKQPENLAVMGQSGSLEICMWVATEE